MVNPDERTSPLIEEFEKQFGAAPTHVSIGPGRVNLIGEHTDYNDGFVLPVALTRDVRQVLRGRDDGVVRLYSLEYDDWGEFHLDRIAFNTDRLWINYVQGVTKMLQQQGLQLRGYDAIVSGNVPRASGLSSSAALEVSSINALLTVSDQLGVLDGTTVAKLAQKAENEFVGVNCGIMDQFISVLGKADHALLIDCRSLDYSLIPFPKDAAMVIGNTKAGRSLAGSAYNERRAECEAGVAAFQAVLPGVTALRDVSSEQLENQKHLLSPTVYRRCRHVVGENERVLATIEALQADDFGQVGALMDASHNSLRDDYEVSSDALDAMVAAMRGVDGCYGARLTGAGFGGCAVALAHPDAVQDIADAIYQGYAKATNIWPEVYTTPAGVGARVIALR